MNSANELNISLNQMGDVFQLGIAILYKQSFS